MRVSTVALWSNSARLTLATADDRLRLLPCTGPKHRDDSGEIDFSYFAMFVMHWVVNLGKSATELSAVEGCPTARSTAAHRTVARCPIGADRGHRAPRSGCQRQEFVREAQYHLHTVPDAEFVVQPLNVRVDGVRGDAQIAGDGEFDAIIKHAARDLEFATGEFQRPGNFRPGLVAKYLRIGRPPRGLAHHGGFSSLGEWDSSWTHDRHASCPGSTNRPGKQILRLPTATHFITASLTPLLNPRTNPVNCQP